MSSMSVLASVVTPQKLSVASWFGETPERGPSDDQSNFKSFLFGDLSPETRCAAISRNSDHSLLLGLELHGLHLHPGDQIH